MRKKSFLLFVILCCITLLAACVFVACNPDDSSQNTGEDNKETDASAYAGKYYEVVNGELDKDSWVELSSDWTWGDSDSAMGTFKVDGKRISFYWIVSSEPAFEGTIGEGEFTVEIIGYTHTYKKGTPSEDDPSVTDPDEKLTVSFNVNGGDEAISPLKFKEGELLTLPTPKREGYNFLGWYDSLGKKYDNTSVMPGISISLTARWEKIVSTYEDDYVYFKPATEGKKQDDYYYYPYQNAGIHHYVYVELASDNIGGPDEVGIKNNFDLASRIDMEFSVASGYTLTWYNDSDFTSINGAQMFTLGYGSNVYFLTVSEGTRVVQRYLVDFYIKHDYYISLYSNVYEDRAYNIGDEVRVVEGETVASSDLANNRERDFEFDKWVYYNEDLDSFIEFDFSTVIGKNWSLYQTFKPKTITATLDGGSMEGALTVQPYVEYQQLPIPTKEGYDFIGWKLSSGSYFADITGYGSSILLSDENYFTSLRADFRLKKYYKNIEDDGDTISYVETVPVVFYNGESRSSIYQIVYLPVSVQSTCPVLDGAPTSSNSIFRGWKKYVDGKVEPFDFDADIEEPQAVFPQFYLTTSGLVGIGKNYSVTSSGFNYTHNVSVYLPSQAEYVLTVSGSASTTVSAYAEQEEQTYTSTSSKSARITLQGNVATGMYVNLTVRSTSGTVTLSLSGPSGYTSMPQAIDINSAQYSDVDRQTTITARERSGYTFLGWYDEDDVKVSADGSLNYTFTMPNADVTYVAKWSKVTVESEDTDKGTVSQLTEVYLPGDEVTVTATTKAGYTFIGWYNGEEKLTDALIYTFEMPSEDVTYTAKWIKVSVESEDTDKGTVSQLTDTYLPGDEATVTATTQTGYTFIGWYNGEEKLTDALIYTFEMPSEDVTYTAKWIKVTVESEDTDKGTVSQLTEVYLPGDEASITAMPKAGYTFIGWYDGDTKVSESGSYDYTFTMPAEPKTYTARWIEFPVEIIVSEEGFGTAVGGETGSVVGGETTVTAQAAKLYVFAGWYNSDGELLCADAEYTFVLGQEPVSLIAKFELAPETASDDFVFSLNSSGDGYTLTSYNGEDTIVVIPSSHNGLPVVEIGSYAFQNDAFIEGIYVPESVTKVGSYAFSGCSGLIVAVLENGVTSIGSAAFSGCSSLEEITIPFVGAEAGKTSYDTYQYPFGYIFGTSGGTAVRQYYYGSSTSSTTYDTYYIPSSLRSVTVTGGNILYGAFYNCSMLTSVTIPDSVTSIGGSAFCGCKGLTSVTIPDSVKSIGNNAFYNCSDLTSVTIGNSVTSIGYQAFYNCSSLTSITIPDSVTSIGSYAFRGCSGLTSITIPDSVTSIGSNAFYDTAWYSSQSDGVVYAGKVAYVYKGTMPSGTSIVLEEGTLGIADDAFWDCSGLKSVTIPDSVTSIGDDAFRNCRGLTSVYYTGDVAGWCGISGLGEVMSSGRTLYIDGNKMEGAIIIPDGITSIPSSAFAYRTGITSITIPDSVTSIGNYAFSYCSGLTSVTIPDSVTSIGSFAFSDCSGLTSVTIGNGVTSIEYRAFYYCSGLTEINWNAVSVSDFSSGSDVFYNAGTAGSGITVTFGDSVKTIPARLFNVSNSYYRPNIKSVTIGNSVTSIGSYAFSDCTGLTSVTIGNSVTSIGYRAFEDCSGLTSVYYTGDVAGWCGISGLGNIMSSGRTLYIDGNKLEGAIVIPDSVTSIGDYAFRGCSGLTSVTIGDSVKSIGSYAFYYCSGLTSITIPDSVTSIGQSAFEGCSGLTSIHYTGDVAGWCGISGLGNIMSSKRTLYIDGNKLEGAIVIPDGVQSVPSYAFFYQTGITSITIPDSVTSIERSAFYGCSGLTSIVIPDSVTSIGNYAFTGTAWYNSQTNGVIYAGKVVYKYKGTMPSNTSVVLEEGTLGIADSAFSDCSGLTSITIPDSVTSIGSYAFYGCSGLTSVTMGNGVTSIGDYAFSGCSGLTEINWNAVSVGDFYYGSNVFYNAGTAGSGITVTFGDSVETIPAYLFYVSDSSYRPNIKSVTIGDSVTSIGGYAFYGCSGLTSITIPNSVTSIGGYAFYGCSGLTSVTIGNGVTSIEDSAFYNCSDLTSIVIPDSVTSIGNSAFRGCSGLTSVTIGSGVTSIGWGAFRDCSGLTSATFENTNGWQVSQTSSFSRYTSLSNGNLSDPSTAANYLKSTYTYYYWRRG